MSNKVVRIEDDLYESRYLDEEILFKLTKRGERVFDSFALRAGGMMTKSHKDHFLKNVHDNYFTEDGYCIMSLSQFAIIFGNHLFKNIDNPLIKGNKYYIKQRKEDQQHEVK